MLKLEHLSTKAGAFELRGIDLDAPAGSYGVLLGPPGAGKSVLIETVCGLRPAAGGRILMDGDDVTQRDPRDRHVGYVPQDYVLFPSKRVIDNVVYGLRTRGVPRVRAVKDVEWAVELLHIGHLAGRWTGTLSGGEQQRVALARALATRPRLLLLDEPVSALDESLRDRVCRELRTLQRELGITTIHISHNIEEALTVSDWAAVLDEGVLQQRGPMRDLLRRPANEMVARFLRTENILEATAEPCADAGSVLAFAGHRVRVQERRSGEVTFAVRPEALRVAAPNTGGENAVKARLTHIADRGVYRRLEYDAGVKMVVFVPWGEQDVHLAVGEVHDIVVDPDAVHILDPDTRKG
ncbi:MAG: ABC transporter ATP-binding protein [Lentisphaerae bacterium]|nr:ABC transporter ATP-binding protein [Lentisphaerota bacterium]